MQSVAAVPSTGALAGCIQQEVEWAISDLISRLPDTSELSAEQRRGIIARYASVLEGNFIYWMTAAYVASSAVEAREIIMENLRQEISECHPGMMRRFAMAAGAVPTGSDALDVYPALSAVRSFIGKLSAVPLLITMAFFEGFIQRFMGYLAELAQKQGSREMQYTDVHGVCDVEHSQELLVAVEAEIAIAQPEPNAALFEGVSLLKVLIEDILRPVHA